MTPILHLTHLGNLPAILATGGLWSPSQMPQGAQPASIAHGHIQSRRATRVVPCGPGGTLHDYVPFYFGERSPMLYANHTGYVAGNQGGQAPLVYLVAYAQQVAAAGHGWVFTDGHAVIAFTRFFDDFAHLNQVDWQTVHAQWWNDTPQDPDRKRRKQAEFLVHGFFPVGLVREIVVLNQQVRAQVNQVLNAAGVALPVRVDPAWYY